MKKQHFFYLGGAALILYWLYKQNKATPTPQPIDLPPVELIPVPGGMHLPTYHWTVPPTT